MKAIFNAFLVNNKKCLAFKKYRLQIKVNKNGSLLRRIGFVSVYLK